MDDHGKVLNSFLTDVFKEILKTEEACLASGDGDLSLRELHLLEEVCRAVDEGRDNRATAIAAAQRVTAGTLTTAVTLLEKKGYLERRRDSRDKRVVRIFPTQKAREANGRHTAFHREMVEEIFTVLTEEEAVVFVRALGSLSAFFRRKYNDSLDGAAAGQKGVTL